MLYVLAEERVGKPHSAPVGGAILDRMVSSAIKLISTTGNSYRKEVMGNQRRASAKSPAKAQK